MGRVWCWCHVGESKPPDRERGLRISGRSQRPGLRGRGSPAGRRATGRAPAGWLKLWSVRPHSRLLVLQPCVFLVNHTRVRACTHTHARAQRHPKLLFSTVFLVTPRTIVPLVSRIHLSASLKAPAERTEEPGSRFCSRGGSELPSARSPWLHMRNSTRHRESQDPGSFPSSTSFEH